MDHHVYFWLKEEKSRPSDRAQFEAGMDELFSIPQVASGRWALPAAVAVRPVCDQSWDYALTMRFADLADHDIYQNHPVHQDFLCKYKDWWAKVLVTDLA